MPNRTFVVIGASLLAFAVGCRKPNAAAHVRRADAFAEKGQVREAILEYQIALQANPKLGDVRLKLGDLYVKSKDVRNAAREYLRASDLLPTNIEAQLKAARLLLVARDFEDAKAWAERAVTIDPKNVDALVQRGNALAGLKDVDGAIREYEEAIALDPTQDTAYANLGRIQSAEGKHADAENTFRKAVAAAPKSVAARLALANFLWSSSRQSESEEVFKSALDLEPKNSVANRALGILYMTTGRAVEAERFFSGLVKNSDETAASLSLADYYIIVKRYEDARRILRDLAVRPDGYPAATVRLASIDTLEGSRLQALGRLRELLGRSPNDASALLLSARLLLLDGKRDEALAAATAILTNDPFSPAAAEAHLIAGRIHTMTDRVNEAIRDYLEALKLQARPFQAYMALAELHLSRGNGEQAAAYAQQALAIQPNNPAPRSLLIRGLVAAGHVDRARAELGALRKAFPTSPTNDVLMALVHLEEKHVDAARVSYARALQLAPDDGEALAGSIQIDLATGHQKEAVALIEGRLNRTAKPDVELLILAGRTYAAAGEFDKAEASLLHVIEAAPDRPQAYVLLGGLYAGQHRLEEAKDKLDAMLKHDAKALSAHILLGTLSEQQGRVDEAEKHYAQALALEPRAAVAANNLAWIYASSNRRLDEALQLAQAAYQQLPDNPSINDTLGWIYYRKHMTTQAIPYLESSVQKVPTEAWFQFHLGMAYMQSGDWQNARRALRQALTLNPNFEAAADARKALTLVGS